MVVTVDGFNSLEELYSRVKPALKSKIKDLNRIGINYVQEADVWNYLKNNLWCKKKNLTLGELVNDIMTVETEKLEEYVHGLFAKDKRDIEENKKEVL